MIDLATVLLARSTVLDPSALVSAATRYGLTLTPTPPRGLSMEASSGAKDAVLSFDLEGGGDAHLVVIDAPHPGAVDTAFGPLSIEPEAIAGTRAHVLVTGRELPGDTRERDRTMLLLVAATLDATEGVSASLVPGVIFHRPGLIRDFAQLAAEEGELPFEVAVDLTSAREPGERMSFLTHGLERYGSEELYVTASVTGRGALDFVLGVGRWFFSQPERRLPTGHTLGRSDTERVTIQRVPSPIDASRTVVRLDLDL